MVVEQEAGQTLLAWKPRRTLGLEGLSPEDQRVEEERLATEPSSAKKLIGKAVRVKENIPAWIYAGGWGDGPGLLHTGAKIWLTAEEEGLVDYLSGPRPPGSSGESRGGGRVLPGELPQELRGSFGLFPKLGKQFPPALSLNPCGKGAVVPGENLDGLWVGRDLDS